MAKFLNDIITKDVGHGGVDLTIRFSDNTFETVHFRKGDNVDDVTYALLTFRLNILEAQNNETR